MKRRMLIKAGLAVAIGRPLLAAAASNRFDAAGEILKKATASGQVESAAMAVRHGDQAVSRGFGAAPNADAIFLLASISKPITVAAVMSLYDSGDFKLSDAVQKFLPEFRGDGRERITMRHLFTHTSGLPDQLPQNAKLRASHSPLSAFVHDAIRTPLLFAPGTRYGYSSMAILLASEVARRISGKPISALVDEVVYRPLGLEHSAMGVGRLDRNALIRCQVDSAAPESGSGKAGTKSWDWNSDYWRELGVPWGGAHGSASDVATFLDAFLHPVGKLLRPETARIMITNQNAAGLRPRGLGFDLGSGLGGPANDRVFGHSGSTGTLCWADPASDTICVILTTLPGRATNPHPRTLASRAIAKTLH